MMFFILMMVLSVGWVFPYCMNDIPFVYGIILWMAYAFMFTWVFHDKFKRIYGWFSDRCN